MKKTIRYSVWIVALILVSTNVMTQDSNQAGESISYTLPPMRILDLEGVAPSLTLSAPTEGGTTIAPATSSNSWINYTSIIENGTTNKVTVAISGSPVPAGTTLKVAAAAYSGNGDGIFGVPAGIVSLSSTAQDLITGIGSCYTGTGNTNGHQLTYTWSVNANGYTNLVSGASSGIIATYTIVAGL